ncbi:uncharacterized protein LOC111480031 [Cucurbita maxima]|uniref:Uncharacterized protein LOC111480031 n=1 Tax=Cucurbita maxima TaxID=3661 RepID=A0A6J1J083_CUCMA|nr:uncharacterized protein LOC111480031 [Cucurbita maxima]
MFTEDEINPMENVTASELAGFAVGALLVCATISAPRIDAFISSSQRRSLGMCKRCGDLRMIACSKCKGVGSTKSGGVFAELYESFGKDEPNAPSIPCTRCNAKGRFPCPDCCSQMP